MEISDFDTDAERLEKLLQLQADEIKEVRSEVDLLRMEYDEGRLATEKESHILTRTKWAAYGTVIALAIGGGIAAVQWIFQLVG